LSQLGHSIVIAVLKKARREIFLSTEQVIARCK
jgi:hypothetical protein